MKRVAIILVGAALIALPFLLRSRPANFRSTDDTVVIVTPHNEAIRFEFEAGFDRWYQAKTGRTVRIDWRLVGGTSDISRYLESAFAGAYELDRNRRGEPWDARIQSSFQDPHVGADSPEKVRRAREEFLTSTVTCGIDVFFGGDAYQFDKEARAGRLVASDLEARYPEWFNEEVLPGTFGGEPFRDPLGRWYGVVLSSYGIIFNREGLRRLGIEREPTQWADLADPRLMGEVGLADPTKSGSVCEAFEAILQQQMQQRVAKAAEADERAAVEAGWTDGLRLIQRMGANARYFTDSSQKPPIDVANGDCAAGLCIDFYGRQQEEAVRRRGASDRIGFTKPIGGSAASADPIGLLRGAPHREVAVAFIEYVLSMAGQKVWALRPGTVDGPVRYPLRRMPVRRDFYRQHEWAAVRSDPLDSPYDAATPFVYHPTWTGSLFREIGFVTRAMCQDTHEELRSAWDAIQRAPEPERAQALSVMEDMSRIDYATTAGEIHRVLNERDRVAEVGLAADLAAWFGTHYREAEAIARGEKIASH